MNGIIHACSHVNNEENSESNITEEEIFRNIFHYIDFLFRMIKPKKVFYMAVDGVAPRAKMNQQRARRFRAGRDRIKKLKGIAEKTGQTLKDTIAQHFDTNGITPGTTFMTNLDEQLKYFINVKLSTDPLWAGVDVHLSGHLTPGEGEHKIMEFIRYTRSQPGYNVNTRHCLYGLDADLVMLGLVTHEMHFALLREEVKYGGKKSTKILTPEEINWHLLQLCLLRDYIDLEFRSVKDKLKFPYDLESIIDDWILMGYLVGNDFIPHLPHVHINQEALPLLWNTYKKVLPTLDGYMNESGELILSRFESYLTELAKYDYERFENEVEGGKDLYRIGSSRGKISELDQDQPVASVSTPSIGFSVEIMEKLKITTTSNEHEKNGQLIDNFINNERKSPLSSSPSSENNRPVFPDADDDEANSSDVERTSDVDEETKIPSTLTTPAVLSGIDPKNKFRIENEFRRHKNEYYREKMKNLSLSNEQIQLYVQQYIEALQWILKYYYQGCPSWSWYYPHHYAPYLSDLKDFKHLQFPFQRGTPFKPFEQLLGVLPPTSRYLLPSVLQPLMINDDSPLLHFYPEDFLLDQNEKKQDWEAIVLLPFIDEEILLKSIEKFYPQLSADEQMRNRHGPSLCFQYTSNEQIANPSLSTNRYFPPLKETHAKCIEYPVDFYRPEGLTFKHGRFDESQMTFFPKFPVLNVLPYLFDFKKGVVDVFESRSKSTTLVLNLTHRPDPDLIQYNDKWTNKDQDNNTQPFLNLNRQGLIERYLGKRVFVNWPHFEYGVVCAISDFRCLYTWSNIPGGSNFNFRSPITDDYFDNRHMNQTPIYVSRFPFEMSEESQKAPSCKTYQFDSAQGQMEYTKAVNINRRYENRQGVIIGPIPVLLYVAPLIGYRTKCSSTSEKCTINMCFSNQAYAYPLQTTLMSVPNYRHDLYSFPKSINEHFRSNDSVFALQSPFFSCLGYVQELTKDNHGKSLVQCRMEPSDILNQPDIHQMSNRLDRLQMNYWTAQQVAEYLRTMPSVISKLTGTIIVTTGSTNGRKETTNRINVGFSWKGNKPLKQLYGYTKKLDQVWHYSDDAVLIIGDYMMQFPEIIAELTKKPKDDTYAEINIWPARKGKSRLQEVRAWIKKLPTYSMQLLDGAWDILDAPVIKEIEKSTKAFYSKHPKTVNEKTKLVGIEPNRLFKSTESLGMCDPDMETHYELYDRVVTVRLGTGVPIGTRGTIIGVLAGQTHLDTYYEVLFDHLPKNSLDAILLGGSNQPCRIKVRSYHLLNYSHSLRARPAQPTQQRSMPAENVWERRTAEQSTATTPSKQNSQPTKILKRGASDNTTNTSTGAATTTTTKPKTESSTTTTNTEEKRKLVDLILASAKGQTPIPIMTKSPGPTTQKAVIIQPLTESALLASSQTLVNKAPEPIIPIVKESPSQIAAPVPKVTNIQDLLAQAIKDMPQMQNLTATIAPVLPSVRPMEMPSHPPLSTSSQSNSNSNSNSIKVLSTQPNGQTSGFHQQNIEPIRNLSQISRATGAPQSSHSFFAEAIDKMERGTPPSQSSSNFPPFGFEPPHHHPLHHQHQQQHPQQQQAPMSLFQRAIQESGQQLNMNAPPIHSFNGNQGMQPFSTYDLLPSNPYSNPHMMPFSMPAPPPTQPAVVPHPHAQMYQPPASTEMPPVASFQQSPGRMANPIRMESPQVISSPSSVSHTSPPSQPSPATQVTSPRASGGSTLQFVPSQVLRNMPKKS